MSLETVTARIPTERIDDPDAVVLNGGEATIPARAKMLPQAPLHRATGVSGQEDHLGVPFEVAEAIDVGDLIALPDVNGHPWATFEVLAEIGPWAQAFPLPDGTPEEEFSNWVHLRVAPARDRLTIASEEAQRATDYWEANRARENARVQREIRRRAAECTEIVEKLRSVGPEHAARAVDDVLDDDGRRALLDALARVEREAAEQEAPVAA